MVWHNQHNIFIYLPNHQHTIGSPPKALSNTLIPFFGAPQTFIHCGPGGAWTENCQFNPTQKLFFEGVFMTNENETSSSQKANLALMFFTWYLKNLYKIESYRKQYSNLKIPKEYDCNSHSQCQIFPPTTPTSLLTPPLYPTIFSLSSKQKLLQLLSVSDPPIVKIPLLPHQKNGLAFLWD
ncbi:hypothetical protein O181_008774 [Austropuccinia psidii MF-1]|uniref:Uncharacterized protein n=1 Tax=Austropuccinia psidii MF-1 TaxID=1389203 RepID=A0A9Q3GJ68_9BASI|nr:hypothetical protein [Austropuccinia psidii MF-1]